MNDPSVWKVAADYGIFGILIAAFFVGLLREWWVLGREMRTERAERIKSEARERYWMELALSGTELAKIQAEITRAEQRRAP